jgi:hypothetical protein
VSANPQHKTPVLLLTFNRPETTAQVLEAIRAARPERLFIASDGPRTHVPQDSEKVAATRAVIDNLVDWPCRVQKRYSDVNQGCRIGVSQAITWFFDQVEEGIILEDDCVPHPDFFGYCTELLDRYRNDPRVMNIAGDNSVGLTPTDLDSSYCFTRQTLIWGWATWRRAWDHYDADLDGWKTLRSDRARLKGLWPDPVERRWQTRKLNRLLETGQPNTWDYRWSFTVQVNEGLSVTPVTNLIRNVGFGAEATHTMSSRDARANVPAQSILPLRHPPTVTPDSDVERQIFDRVHGGATLRNPLRRTTAFGRRLASMGRRALRSSTPRPSIL